MIYFWIKTVHIGTVIFTISFFTLRFIGMINRAGFVNHRWVRRISQINDTLLLTAGISLALMSHQYPFVASWLTAKLSALFVYIILGMFALKWAKSRRGQILSGLLALICAGYIVSVALTRMTRPWESLSMAQSVADSPTTVQQSDSTHPGPITAIAYVEAVSDPASENG